ncbi:hypothetical protein SDC9_146493 [bioreactor metagenome]|uniref:Uncharacterized protein n=1 Tax=bioreactor metagenome TaxID=1076179 RepID=A0A645EFD2_9ZZZZ
MTTEKYCMRIMCWYSPQATQVKEMMGLVVEEMISLAVKEKRTKIASERKKIAGMEIIIAGSVYSLAEVNGLLTSALALTGQE